MNQLILNIIIKFKRFLKVDFYFVRPLFFLRKRIEQIHKRVNQIGTKQITYRKNLLSNTF